MEYIEQFDEGPGGWFGWISNSGGPETLEVADSCLITRSPWWIDYNHAPPGAGYLHMLCVLLTSGRQGEHFREVAGENRFIEGGFPTDFTDARVTLRLKGELEAKGAQMLLLCQGSQGDLGSGWLLTGQPLEVTEDWSEQTLTVVPDPAQWNCLGSRHDRTDFYGEIPLTTILGNANSNILFVLHPLQIEPMGPIDGDPHLLRPEKDYPVWRSRLPEGYILLDTVSIEFP